ncbi:MAG TPA: thioredoxin domain-containing protein [Salinivirgaceae bacterium]|nr:thioredoxin domain-containing protein [Salinivirgaceae bacterium]
MKKILFSSTVISIISLIFVIYLPAIGLYATILFFALFTLVMPNASSRMLNDWLLIYLPFFVLHSIPLIIFNFTKSEYLLKLFAFSEISFILSGLVPVFIYAALIIKHHKLNGLILVVAYALFIVTGFYSWHFQTFIAGTIFLILGIYLPLNPNNSFFKNFLFLYFPIFVVYTLSLLWESLFDGSRVEMNWYTLPINLIIPISILIGLKVRQRKYKIIRIIPLVIVFAFIGFIVHPNWSTFLLKRDDIKEIPSICIISDTNDTIDISESSKIVVLNIWSTSCGVCFREFPEYEKLFNKYKDNPRVDIYSVNVPLKRDSTHNTVERVREKYCFPIHFAEKSFCSKLNIQSFPKMIIFKNKELIYSGSPEYENKNYWNCYRIIEKAIQQ